MYHSGFTGKSGPETWWQCKFKQKYLRHIEKCELAGDYEKQKNEFVNSSEAKSKAKGDDNEGEKEPGVQVQSEVGR
jgi:hypothetical protein